jgi:hypothetical protein
MTEANMSHLKNQLGTGAALVAMAFGVVAPLSAQGAGLIDDDAAVSYYRGGFSTAIRKAAGDDLAGGRARVYGGAGGEAQGSH